MNGVRGVPSVALLVIVALLFGGASSAGGAAAERASLPDVTVEAYSGSGQLVTLPDEAGGEARVRYAIATDESVTPVAATPGMAAAVGDSVTLRAGSIVASSPRSASRSGDLSVLGILVAYSDQAVRPFTPAQLQAAIDGPAASASTYYLAQSGGRVNFAGTVVPNWVELGQPMTNNCTDTSFTERALAGAIEQGYDPSQYDRVVMLTNRRTPGCSFAGLGTTPGDRVWLYATTAWQTLAHELGHNFGLAHATSLSCGDGGVTVAFSSSCVVTEYGDRLDVMGASSDGRFMSTFHRAEAGQLVGTSRTVTTSETVTIADAASVGPSLIRIPRRVAGAPLTSEWALELRARTSVFDTFASDSPAVNGVTIRLTGRFGQGEKTGLIDTHPATVSVLDAPLASGETFTDAERSISVQVDDISGSTATVTITQPSIRDSSPPTISNSLSAERLPEGVVRLSWFEGTDDETAPAALRYELRRDGALVRVVTAAEAALPTASYRLVVQVSEDAGAHSYTVAPIDEAGNIGAPLGTTLNAIPLQGGAAEQPGSGPAPTPGEGPLATQPPPAIAPQIIPTAVPIGAPAPLTKATPDAEATTPTTVTPTIPPTRTASPRPAVSLSSPKLKNGKARLPASRTLRFRTNGKGTVLTIKIGSGKPRRGKSVTLTRAQARSSAVIVTATGQDVAKTTLRFRVSSGAVRVG